jgi:hypothetical protein
VLESGKAGAVAFFSFKKFGRRDAYFVTSLTASSTFFPPFSIGPRSHADKPTAMQTAARSNKLFLKNLMDRLLDWRLLPPPGVVVATATAEQQHQHDDQDDHSSAQWAPLVLAATPPFRCNPLLTLGYRETNPEPGIVDWGSFSFGASRGVRFVVRPFSMSPLSRAYDAWRRELPDNSTDEVPIIVQSGPPTHRK